MTRILSFVAVLLFSSPLDAACDYRHVSSAPYRLTAHDVELDGAHLWVATSYGLAVYDRSVDPPVPVSSIALPGPTTDVVTTGGYAYASSGTTLRVVGRPEHHLVMRGSLDVGAAIHDLLYMDPWLYLATSTGIVVVSLASPEGPVEVTRLSTSSGAAFSLAARGSFVYAADGDATIEVIANSSVPAKAGSFSSLPRSSSIAVAGERIFVSDGTQTEFFGEGGEAPTRLGTIGFGATTLSQLSGSVVYTGGSDRRVRAIDLAVPETPVLLFESELPASFGAVNRVESLASADGMLYVAAGDLGLVTFDARDFVEPFPARHFAIGSFGSATAIGTRLFLAPRTGGLESYSVSQTGALQRDHQFNAGTVSVLHDVALSPARLLVSSGASLTLWDAGGPPAMRSTVTLRDTIRSAVMNGLIAHAVISDGSVWRVDYSSEPAISSIVPIPGSAPSSIARGGYGIGLVDLNAEGTTTIRYFPTGDLSETPLTASVDGLATSGIAMSADGVAAAVTFRGVSVVDFRASPATVSVIAGSARGPARDLFIDGNDLLILYGNELDVRNLGLGTLIRRLVLPKAGTSLAAGGGLGFVAGDEGVSSVNYRGSSMLPTRLPSSSANMFHRKMLVLPERLFLLSGGSVETRPLQWNGLPGNAMTIAVAASTIDMAVIGGRLFTLTVDGKLTARNLSGAVVAEFEMLEGSDAEALSLNEVAGALHLSLSRGCLSGACEKKTLVLHFDGTSISRVSTYQGALIDVKVHGSRAFVLVEGPNEIRTLDVRDPQRPVVIDSRPSEGNPVAISFSDSTIYTIGRRLYAYSEAGIMKVGELLSDYVADPIEAPAYTDQSLEIVGSCAVIAGRSFSPQVFTIVSPVEWEWRESRQMPSAARDVVAVGERLYFLTGHSLEIWTTEPAPSRRRPAR